MSSDRLVAIEAVLAIAVIFGLASWQLVSVRRSIRRDRQDSKRPSMTDRHPRM